VINAEELMDIRALHRQGLTYAEIGRLVGRDWRTVKRYLVEGAQPVYRRRRAPSVLDPLKPVVDQWLAREPRLLARTPASSWRSRRQRRPVRRTWCSSNSTVLVSTSTAPAPRREQRSRPAFLLVVLSARLLRGGGTPMSRRAAAVRLSVCVEGVEVVEEPCRRLLVDQDGDRPHGTGLGDRGEVEVWVGC
jgi:hypothetical protein